MPSPVKSGGRFCDQLKTLQNPEGKFEKMG